MTGDDKAPRPIENWRPPKKQKPVSMLPTTFADGSVYPPPVFFDAEKLETFERLVGSRALDSHRAQRVINSVEVLLRRHASMNLDADWTSLKTGLTVHRNSAQALFDALSEAEAHTMQPLGVREIELLRRASERVGFDEGINQGRRPGTLRGHADPLSYNSELGATRELKAMVARRLAVLAVAEEAFKGKGRPEGAAMHPIVEELRRYWIHLTGTLPSYTRQDGDRDRPIGGKFFAFCHAALECLPEKQQHGMVFLSSAVRAVCSKKEIYRNIPFDDHRLLDLDKPRRGRRRGS